MAGRTLAHLRPYLIPLYFTLGGVAGGLLFLGALAQGLGLAALAAAPRVRDACAIPLILVSGAILTADLTHPLRFWRLLVTFRPSSPVSWGSWILTGAGLVAALEAAPAGRALPVLGHAFVAADAVRLAAGPRLVHALAALFGVGLAGYTGVLLAASSRLRWHATPLFGAVFLATAFTSAAALVMAAAEGGAQRALFVAVLGGIAAGLLRSHLQALDVEHRQGRLDPVLPPGAQAWLANATLAAVLAAALLPLAAAMGGVVGRVTAATVLAADLGVRFAAFWMEEGPAPAPPEPLTASPREPPRPA